jgi:hypothetical protein
VIWWDIKDPGLVKDDAAKLKAANAALDEITKRVEKLIEIEKTGGDFHELDDGIDGVVKNTTQDEFVAQKKWYGISGSWRLKSEELYLDLAETVDKIIASGGGIVSGGALGVDYLATERMMTTKDWQKHLKIIIPTPLDVYEKHFLKRAGEGVITHEQANDLLASLKKVKAGGCLVEMNHTALNDETYFDRNTEVVKACDELLAFQINDSRGVQDTVDKAAELGKKVLLKKYYVEDGVVKNTTYKIGLIEEFMDEGVDADVRARVEEYVTKLTEAGHAVSKVSLPMAKYALPIYYIVVPAEVSSNLARYDGVRYGARADAQTLAEVYGRSRDAGFVDENKRRIMIGSYVLSSGFFDAYYLQAQKARTLLINEFDKLFEEYDFLIGPVSPTPAFKLGERASDPLQMYLADIMTVPASLAGLPAISIPAGASDDGLPVGVQIIGQMKDDARLLEFAKEMNDV